MAVDNFTNMTSQLKSHQIQKVQNEIACRTMEEIKLDYEMPT